MDIGPVHAAAIFCWPGLNTLKDRWVSDFNFNPAQMISNGK